MNKIKYPENPKEGDRFSYVCPISGCTVVYLLYREGKWNHIKTL
jgi:hypothetical protein